MIDINKIIKRVNWPECYKGMESISPKEIKFTVAARLKCQNCGLYNRTPKCPPYVDFLEDIQNKFKQFNNGKIIVYQSDGSISWKPGIKLDREPLKGKQLKGTVNGMARHLNRAVHDVVRYMISQCGFKKDITIMGFISGHCDICGKCPLKDRRDVDNKILQCKKGYSSLEAIGVDCFNLMDLIGVEHEVVPWNKVTLIGGIIWKE